MVRRYRGNEKLWVGWTLDDAAETEIEAQVEVTPGSPGRGPSYSSGGDPPEPPEMSVLAVRSADKKPLANADDLIAMLEKDDAFYEKATLEAGEKNESDYAAACDAACDADRDRRYFGDDY